MNIQVQSQMRYGDEDALRDFFFVHRLVHKQVDAAIARTVGVSLADSTLDSDSALTAWLLVTADGEMRDEDQNALLDWLQLHASLHQAEYAALGLGFAPDLSVVDFKQENQFYDWMYAHAAVHDTLASVTGTL